MASKIKRFLALLGAAAACGCNPSPHPTHPNQITCKFAYVTSCGATISPAPPDPTRDVPCVGAPQTWQGSSGFVERKACVQPALSRGEAYTRCQAFFSSAPVTEANCTTNQPGGTICPGTLRSDARLTPITDVDSDPSPLRVWGPNECNTETRLPLIR